MTRRHPDPAPATAGRAAGQTIEQAAPVAALLPEVVHETAAAILLVDLGSGQVTFANPLAHELAPGTTLPIDVDDWSQAAGLQDFAGADLGEADAQRGSRPLSRVAAGEPVFGEAVTAARATSSTLAREPLWVLGLPLTGGPEPLATLALVVFLPQRNAQAIAGAQESAASLRDRAVLATRMSFTISDPAEPDNPLVWVNPAFTHTTGYQFDEAVGRNCRFLQGPKTDARIIAEIRECLRTGTTMTTTLLNYRKDGSEFWNQLSISPITDGEGTVTHFVGVQADVSDRINAEHSREAALRRAETATQRMATLASFTRQIATTLESDDVIGMLSQLVVPRLATWCALYQLDEQDRLHSPSMLHERAQDDPEVAHRLARLAELVPSTLPDDGPIWRILRGEEQYLLVEDVEHASTQTLGSTGDERSRLTRELGFGSLIVVPLAARGRIIGAFAAVNGPERAGYDVDDLTLIRDLAARAGLMIDNATLYSRERDAAETLQRGLLPVLPKIDGLQVHAEYMPATVRAAVGGDWYDVFPIRDGRVGIAVGDAMGHDFDAAATMGQLRYMLRSYAWPGSAPDEVLTAMDDLVTGMELDQLATCVYGRLTLPGEGDTAARFEYASAGHPPMVVLHPDGSARLLDGGRGVMIGVQALAHGQAPRPLATVDVPRGSTLVGFTDGLVDGFGGEFDDALESIRVLVESYPGRGDGAGLIESLVALVRNAARTDDVAVLAVRID